MSTGYDVSTKNLVIALSEAYFTPSGETGAIYMGDTTTLAVTQSVEKTKIQSTSTPIAVDRVNMVKSVSREMTLETQDVTDQLEEIFFMGTKTASTQSATPVTGEAHAGLVGGRWYQCGVTTDNPFGKTDLSAFSITNDAVTPVAGVLGTDYEVNLAAGKFYIIEGGLLDGDGGIVAYTPTAVSKTRIQSHNNGPARGSLMVTPVGTTGTQKPIFLPLVELGPSGDVPYNDRENSQKLSFSVSILDPGDGSSQIELFGATVAA